MILSKLRPLRILVSNANQPKVNLETKRNSGGHGYYGYRENNYREDLPLLYKVGWIMGGFTVWWVLWHCYHEPGHLFGEFTYVNRFKLSDEELGIPSDEDGLAPTIPNVKTCRIPGVLDNHRNIGKHYLEMHHGDVGQFKM